MVRFVKIVTANSMRSMSAWSGARLLLRVHASWNKNGEGEECIPCRKHPKSGWILHRIYVRRPHI